MVEFVDERSTTLLELLNKISDELGENNGGMKSKMLTPGGITKFNNSLLSSNTSQRSSTNPLPKDINAVVKEHGNMSPTSTDRYKVSRNIAPTTKLLSSQQSKTKTLPEIQLTRASPIAKALAGATEIILSAADLSQQSKQVKFQPSALKAIKKTPAPQHPSNSTFTSTDSDLGHTQRPNKAPKPPMLGMIKAMRSFPSSERIASTMTESFDTTFLSLNDSRDKMFARDTSGDLRQSERNDGDGLRPKSPDAFSITTAPRSPRLGAIPFTSGDVRKDVSSNGKSWL